MSASLQQTLGEKSDAGDFARRNGIGRSKQGHYGCRTLRFSGYQAENGGDFGIRDSGEVHMTLAHRIVVGTFKGLTSLICRIDDAQLARVPDRGPLIVVTNHVNILEVPIIYTRLQPRPVAGLVSAHRWDNPVWRWLLDVVGAIPLRRGGADVAAVRTALEVLEAGQIIIVDPEGTRSGDGRLQKGYAGVAVLALHSGAPLLPVVFYGGEHYLDNLRRLRRTDFHIAVGRPFTLDAGGVKMTRQVRGQMIDEVMYQMAALLPPAYRGVYSDLSRATERYLVLQPGLR